MQLTRLHLPLHSNHFCNEMSLLLTGNPVPVSMAEITAQCGVVYSMVFLITAYSIVCHDVLMLVR